MRTSRSTLRSALAAVTVAAAMTAGTATAFADGGREDDPNGDKNATTCNEDGVGLEGHRLVEEQDYTYTGGVINEDTFVAIDWVHEGLTVTGVVVKGGPGFNVYKVGADLNPAPEGLPWEGLRAPDNPGGQTPTLSHWFVCGYPDGDDNDNPPTTDTTTTTPSGTETSTPTTGPATSTTTPAGGETTTPGESSTPTSPSQPSSQPAAPTVTSTTEAAPVMSSDDTENLAYTGFDNAWLVWLGGALVLAGAAALALLRVRRSRG